MDTTFAFSAQHHSSLNKCLNPNMNLLSHCPRKIAADVRKMKVYNWTRSDLSRSKINTAISRIIRNQTWAKSLKLSLDCTETINLALSLPYLKRLNLLSLDFSSEFMTNVNMNSNTLQLLSKILKTLKQLSVLRLKMQTSKKLSDWSIKQFAFKLDSYRSLKKLCLSIKSFGKYDNSFVFLSEAISKMTCLTNFQITLDNFKIAHLRLNTAMSNIARLTALTHLRIDLNLSVDYDIAIIVAKSLPRMKKLIHLHLNFSFCLEIGDKGIIDLSRGLGCLINLSELELSFQRCLKFSDKGAAVLSKELQKLSKLEHLQLMLMSCTGITNIGIRSLTQSVVTLPALNTFYFGFGHWPNISDECLEDVVKLVSAVSTLSDLKFIFESQSPQNGGGLVTMAQNLKNLENISKLSLKFHSRFITDMGIQTFAENLQHMKHLTELKLNFNSRSHITDNGILLLSKGIGVLSKLQVFEIVLIQPKMFSQFGISYLMQALGKFNHELMSLNRRCHFCEGLDDNALICLGSRLFKIRALTFLRLVCFACQNITDIGIDALSKSIFQSHHHIEAYLDFVLCHKITEKGYMMLREFKDE